MFGSQLCPRYPVSGSGSVGSVTDHPRSIHRIPNSLALCSYQSPFRSLSKFVTCEKLKPIVITCHDSRGRFGPKSHHSHSHSHREYLEASLLISETVNHYRLCKQEYQEDVNWQPFHHNLQLSHRDKYLSTGSSSLGLESLRLYQRPTIFLKISCEGDFLLPITVGEFAVKEFIDSLQENYSEDFPNQFQFVRNFASELGYQVKMVEITERVADKYFAKIYFSKVGVKESFSIDACPSDAINLARRCKAPIFVNKLFLIGAPRIPNRTRRVHAKPCYDVFLDSASEGPDILLEELDVVNKMNSAIKEERYSDAALCRDKLMKLRKSCSEH